MATTSGLTGLLCCADARPVRRRGRVPGTGPDFVNTDFSVIKRFAAPGERKGLDFRAEFFNLFNHPQFGMPTNDINTPSATLPNGTILPNSLGLVSSTVNNPRLIQLAMKLTF